MITSTILCIFNCTDKLKVLSSRLCARLHTLFHPNPLHSCNKNTAYKCTKAEEKRKQLKEQRRELEKQAYENRLTTRAIMLEEFLQEPEILTNEDVRNYLAYLFNYPANQQRLQKLIADRKAQLAATE